MLVRALSISLHTQRDGFTDTQTRRVNGHQQRPVLEVRNCRYQPVDFLTAEHLR